MPLRTRTKSVYSTVYRGGFIIERAHVSSPNSWSQTGVLQSEFVTQVPEAMTDRTGSPTTTNPCDHSKIELSCQDSDWKVTTTSGSVWNYRTKTSFPMSVGPMLYTKRAHASVNPSLIALAIGRVPAHVPELLQGIVSLAEMHQLADTGAQRALLAFARLAAAAYRGKFRDSKRAARLLLRDLRSLSPAEAIKSLIGMDLEWKFGWQPFIKDVMAASNAFDRVRKTREALIKGKRVYGKAKETYTHSPPDENLGAIWGTVPELGSRSLTWNRNTSCQITASIVRRLKRSAMGNDIAFFDALLVTETLGLNPSLAKAWELVPLSFVVDWFIPVGNMLESLGGLRDPALSWVESYDGILSTKTESTISGSLKSVAGDQPPAFGTLKNVTYSRAGSTLSGTPPIYLPPFSIPLDVSKWWTGLELALQRVMR